MIMGVTARITLKKITLQNLERLRDSTRLTVFNNFKNKRVQNNAGIEEVKETL